MKGLILKRPLSNGGVEIRTYHEDVAIEIRPPKEDRLPTIYIHKNCNYQERWLEVTDGFVLMTVDGLVVLERTQNELYGKTETPEL